MPSTLTGLRQSSSKRSSTEGPRSKLKQHAVSSVMEVRDISVLQHGTVEGLQSGELLLRPPAELLRMLQDSERASQVLSLQNFLQDCCDLPNHVQPEQSSSKQSLHRMTLDGQTEVCITDNMLPLSAPISTTKLQPAASKPIMFSSGSEHMEALLETGLDVPATPPSLMSRVAPVRAWTCSDRGAPRSPSSQGDSNSTSLPHALSYSPFQSVHALEMDHLSGCSADSLAGRTSVTRTASGPILEPSNDGRGLTCGPAVSSVFTEDTLASPRAQLLGLQRHPSAGSASSSHPGFEGQSGSPAPPAASADDVDGEVAGEQQDVVQVTNLVAMWERTISQRSIRASFSRNSFSSFRLPAAVDSEPLPALRGPECSSQVLASHWLADQEEEELLEIGSSFEIHMCDIEMMEQECDGEDAGGYSGVAGELVGVYQDDQDRDLRAVASSIPWLIMGALAALPVLLQPHF